MHFTKFHSPILMFVSAIALIIDVEGRRTCRKSLFRFPLDHGIAKVTREGLIL